MSVSTCLSGLYDVPYYIIIFAGLSSLLSVAAILIAWKKSKFWNRLRNDVIPISSDPESQLCTDKGTAGVGRRHQPLVDDVFITSLAPDGLGLCEQ